MGLPQTHRLATNPRCSQAKRGSAGRLRTVNLIAEVKNGKPVMENVLVEQIAENHFRLLRSPGLVRGLAAGDEFCLADNEVHGYRLLKRAGNICVHIYFLGDVTECRDALAPLVERMGGRLDGEVSMPNSGLLVFTFPVSAGFKAIEDVMETAKVLSPNSDWYYGNVYALKDDITPLNWWSEFMPR